MLSRISLRGYVCPLVRLLLKLGKAKLRWFSVCFFLSRGTALGGHRGPDGISGQMWRQNHFVSQPTWSQQLRARRVIRVTRQHGRSLELCTRPSWSKSKKKGEKLGNFLVFFPPSRQTWSSCKWEELWGQWKNGIHT